MGAITEDMFIAQLEIQLEIATAAVPTLTLITIEEEEEIPRLIDVSMILNFI
jgi:hypothetical protein